ncbi:VOC family protein [Bacillus daqingensis]|uniref:VOC family protein n=1 Tax=Bacillus daqingensis TaxID=872396 RepID=A0ABV9NP99_9BACI
MKIKTEGISELVLEVASMDRAVHFWSRQLGFPVVEQWGMDEGQFSKEGRVHATWLYVGGVTRLGLWLKRPFSSAELKEKEEPVSTWKGLYDEGGVHVHVAFKLNRAAFPATVALLQSEEIDYKWFQEDEQRLYVKDPDGNIVEFYERDMKQLYSREAVNDNVNE